MNVCASVTDWQGRPITKEESLDEVILVWEIEPHYNNDYDCLIERSYQQAIKQAELVLEKIFDQADPEELVEGVALKIRLIPITVQEYMEIHYADVQPNHIVSSN